LTLLVLWRAATNNPQHALPPNNTAVFTAWLNRRLYLHVNSPYTTLTHTQNIIMAMSGNRLTRMGLADPSL